MKKLIKFFLERYWIQIVIWSCFITYETIVVGLIFGVFGHPITYIVHYGLVLTLFYISSDLILPWGLKQKKKAIWRIPLLYILCILSFILSNYFIDRWLLSTNIITHVTKVVLNREFVLRVLYRCIYILGFSTAYYFLINYLKARRNAEILEKRQLIEIIKNERISSALAQAENSFLRAQINPHFFFNTLGYIHHHINKHSKEAAEAIILLSEMMRYAMDSTNNKGFISLDHEMEQVEKLLNLHQMRISELLNMDINIDPKITGIRFIPLVLITLAENMIKHGDLIDKETPAIFSICLDERERLTIRTQNVISCTSKLESTKNGLKNIISRLYYSYGEDAIIEIKTIDNLFTVEISVSLFKINSNL